MGTCVARLLPAAWLQQKVRALSDAPMQGFVVQHAADAYFYPRAPEAMNGAAVRRFPVAVVDFGDAEATRVYLDLATGDPLLMMGHRAGRALAVLLPAQLGPAGDAAPGRCPAGGVAAAERCWHRVVCHGDGDRLSAIADEAAAQAALMPGYTRSQRVDIATSNKAVATPMNAAIRPK
jgi:hypothetical protein